MFGRITASIVSKTENFHLNFSVIDYINYFIDKNMRDLIDVFDDFVMELG